MQICLEKLYAENFKGVRQVDIDFKRETDIHGDNATGKTSIFYALFPSKRGSAYA